MTLSDVASGVLLVVLGWRSLTPNLPKSVWACCFIGVWLTLALVLFWAPTAAAYLNDSFVGILIMALHVLTGCVDHATEAAAGVRRSRSDVPAPSTGQETRGSTDAPP